MIKVTLKRIYASAASILKGPSSSSVVAQMTTAFICCHSNVRTRKRFYCRKGEFLYSSVHRGEFRKAVLTFFAGFFHDLHAKPVNDKNVHSDVSFVLFLQGCLLKHESTRLFRRSPLALGKMSK